MNVRLEPVDGVQITTLMDNYSDALLPSEGPAKRAFGINAPAPRIAVETFEGGESRDSLMAEHGFSALVTVSKNGRQHTILFDTGVSPDGLVENMRRLNLTPKDAEAIVLSHGHFDHTGGMAGLIRELGRPNLPVMIHPEFWSRRRLAVPGSEPREIPTTSKSALRGAGFEVIEERQPSFLLERSVLITGEVDRTTAYEQGFPVHQKFDGLEWIPDPLILDDQAVELGLLAGQFHAAPRTALFARQAGREFADQQGHGEQAEPGQAGRGERADGVAQRVLPRQGRHSELLAGR